MDPSERPIEIFAPFGEAFETTKKILFRPFDIGKWFVIGFAAWLATMFSGGGFNFRRPLGNSDWDWEARTRMNSFSFQDMPPWVIPLAIGGGLFVLAIIVLLLWLNARGHFMFTDCIVRNRGAIAEPWREYHAEGNRYFIIRLVVTFCSILVFGGLALLFVLGWHSHKVFLPLPIIILFAVAFFLIAVVIGLILKFMVPVMYRQRCDAMAAFRAVWELIAANPVAFLLFGLFYIVLCVAAAMIGCLAACVTCCIAALPYIGTVILLPVVMFLFTYPLCFIRQFGDPYDVWAVVRPTAELPSPGLPLDVPPVQEPPPPAPPAPLV
ncbi:MAG TPA: hypothetical protein VH207_07320 [Chthoniobacterales bacterium]|nr:hypothetical protein [Chthoniobacterales bacterium]